MKLEPMFDFFVSRATRRPIYVPLVCGRVRSPQVMTTLIASFLLLSQWTPPWSCFCEEIPESRVISFWQTLAQGMRMKTLIVWLDVIWSSSQAPCPPGVSAEAPVSQMMIETVIDQRASVSFQLLSRVIGGAL